MKMGEQKRCSDEENVQKKVYVCFVQKAVNGLVGVVKESNIKK